jgi:hypothetical protein
MMSSRQRNLLLVTVTLWSGILAKSNLTNA